MGENTEHKRSSGKLEGLLRKLGVSRFSRRIFGQPTLLALLIAVFLAALITPRFAVSFKSYRVGQFADHSIKADHDFDVEDASSTERRREEAAAAIRPVFDHDTEAAERQVKRLTQAFAEMRAFYGWEDNGQQDNEQGLGRAGLLTKAAIAEQQERFSQTLNGEIDEKTFEYLTRAGYPASVATPVRDLLKYALSRLVVHDKAIIDEQINSLPQADRSITLRELGTKKERRYVNLAKVWDLETLRENVQTRSRQQVKDEQRRKVVTAMAVGMLAPTLDFNRAATEERRAEARDKVGPSIIHFKKNQLIVADGQPITEGDLVTLKAMQTGASIADTLLATLALIGVLFGLLFALFQFAKNNVRKFSPSMRDYGFLITTGALAGLLMWLAERVAMPLSESYWWLTRESVMYVFPIAGVCMLVRFLLYSEAALVWLAFVAMSAGLMVEESIGYAIFVMVTSLVGAHRVGRAHDSRRVVRASFQVALAGAGLAVALQVLDKPTSLWTIATPVNLMAGLFGGLASGPFLLAMSQPFESLFGFTSNLRLMELANLNHPLLGRLLVEAPGTYHHSLMVSALAEKGAEAIGANPLLAKVAGMYHDVGKINKAQYFIENQAAGNPHDGLPPTMSALILINHVREGEELALRYKLGGRLRRIITEHHGRSRIHYFFNRAKQQIGDKAPLNDEDFRYRGPRPQSKESALVLLADVVEAATRSLKAPAPSRIEAAVRELIGDIYNDGQLDECEMTLKDLHKVAVQFTAILTGRYHGRIAYPEKESPRRGKVVNIAPSAEPEKADHES